MQSPPSSLTSALLSMNLLILTALLVSTITISSFRMASMNRYLRLDTKFVRKDMIQTNVCTHTRPLSMPLSMTSDSISSSGYPPLPEEEQRLIDTFKQVKRQVVYIRYIPLTLSLSLYVYIYLYILY